MAVTTKIIKKENNNKSSLVITKHGSDGEERNSQSGTVSWNDESDDEDHLYELIRGDTVNQKEVQSIKKRFYS